MKIKSSILAATLTSTILVTSPLVYGDDSSSCPTKKDKTSTNMTTDKNSGSYNDTSHQQTDNDQTKAAQKSKNAPGG